jgi:hypothetical protein
MTMVQFLAENNFGDTRDGAPAGPMGLFIILMLAVVTVLLIRNMNARIRRLPDRFPDQDSADDGNSGDRPATPSADARPDGPNA